VFGSKNPVLKGFGVKVKKQGQIQGFPNIPNLWKIQNLFYSKLSENYEKMTLKLIFGNREKLVPTRKPTRMFGLKFGMQGLNHFMQLCVFRSIFPSSSIKFDSKQYLLAVFISF